MNGVERVGGKNASLGEMISNLSGAGVTVPGGFATTAHAYREFLAHEGLNERINAALKSLDVDDVNELARVGSQIRQWIIDTPLPPVFETHLRTAYDQLLAQHPNLKVAVRSSATAEDLPDASFAGQQETFLNIEGFNNIKRAVHEVFASLFNDRAISYRVHRGYAHENVALSAGVQKMVRSETGAAGVMFTLDTESGFRDAVFVTASWGLGETVVQGSVNPDEFYVHKSTLAAGRPAVLRRNLGSKMIKMVYGDEASAGRSVATVDVPLKDRVRFCITDDQVMALARQAMTIEAHYQRPMDIEWALDGDDGELYIVQARPETVVSQQEGGKLERFHLKEKGRTLVTGRAIGQRIGRGAVKVVFSPEDMDKVNSGDVLVTDMTDPDWEPIMKRAAAIVTKIGRASCREGAGTREGGGSGGRERGRNGSGGAGGQ